MRIDYPLLVQTQGRGRYDYGRLRIHRNELDRYLEAVDRRPGDDGTRAHTESGVGSNEIGTASVGNEILTREDAALQLGVSWRTIKRYIDSGKLRLAGYFRCSDSYTRAHVYRSDVERLIRGEPRG